MEEKTKEGFNYGTFHYYLFFFFLISTMNIVRYTHNASTLRAIFGLIRNYIL